VTNFYEVIPCQQHFLHHLCCLENFQLWGQAGRWWSVDDDDDVVVVVVVPGDLTM
jgi:hypothetical protein